MAQERTAPAEYFNDFDPEKVAKQLAEQLAAEAEAQAKSEGE
jgi:hypothetical protein